MKLSHHNLLVELNDEWWAEADVVEFVPNSRSYRAPGTYKDQQVYEVSIEDVGPVCRASVFKDDREGERQTARERVLRLLRGFRAGDAIPPVEWSSARRATDIATSSRTEPIACIARWPQDSHTFPPSTGSIGKHWAAETGKEILSLTGPRS